MRLSCLFNLTALKFIVIRLDELTVEKENFFLLKILRPNDQRIFWVHSSSDIFNIHIHLLVYNDIHKMDQVHRLAGRYTMCTKSIDW